MHVYNIYDLSYNIEWLTAWRFSSSCNKEKIIELHMHVHVASSPAYKHMMKLPTTIFRTRQKEPGDEANTNIALLSAMKQQSLMLLVAYAMTDFALWQLV